MSLTQFQQIRRYIHIANLDLDLSNPADWYKKMEPFSSIIRKKYQRFYKPSSNVTVDEAMIRFEGRSSHSVQMPKKPISEGYKVFVLADYGYTFD